MLEPVETPTRPRVVLLTGGLGGARLAPALLAALGPDRLTIIANSGDDLTWLGLRICPDLDSVLYALAGRWDTNRGWGVRDESWHVRDALVSLGRTAWFNVGDRDLAFHLLRAELRGAGATLTEATRELAALLGIEGVTVLPASDEPAETRVEAHGGRVLHFQQWYVREGARPVVRRTLLAQGTAAPAALAALASADAVVLGPSNPVASIGAILHLDGVRDAVQRVPLRIAVSPVVNGIASEDPGIRHHALGRRQLLKAEGCLDTPAAIAARYAGLVQWFFVDRSDADEQGLISAAGLGPITADLLDSAALARRVVDVVERAPGRSRHDYRARSRG